MSYLDFPRIHFSGRFKASPSTINNTPNNFNPLVYPEPNELDKVELYWNPWGDNGFYLEEDCVVTQVDYEDGTSATSPSEDSIIGQPVKAIRKPNFPLQSAMVDLDPMQQNVTEIWAMVLQIGGDDANLTGHVPHVAFSGIWQQCQSAYAPPSSESGSAVFQVKMKDVSLSGSASDSRFLQHFQEHPSDFLSLNMNTNGHNNDAPNYLFSESTFEEMAEAGVPGGVLDKMRPLQKFFQNVPRNGAPLSSVQGYIPTEKFVTYMLQHYLTVEEFNDFIETILAKTKQPYAPHSFPFLYGMVTGTVGPAAETDPVYFVPSRVMVPPASHQGEVFGFYAPFDLNENGMLSLNLGNSLPTKTPGNDIYQDKLGELILVAFPHADISIDKAEPIAIIPYRHPDFYGKQAGFFTHQLGNEWHDIPLGIVSASPDGNNRTILLAENLDGLFMRADQFVFRMNPGYATTKDFPRGRTNIVDIHVLQFGKPVADGTEIVLSMKGEKDAINYTKDTLGTSGTLGLKNLSIPQDRLHFPRHHTVETHKGIARFEVVAEAPGNPRHYVDGQVYFLDYNFKSHPIDKDINDLLSFLVYNQEVEEDAPTVLAKFGRLYKIMDFLADEEKIKQIDLRNMIKTLIRRPMTDLIHMPVTRDLSAAARDKVVEWVDRLNNS